MPFAFADVAVVGVVVFAVQGLLLCHHFQKGKKYTFVCAPTFTKNISAS